MSSGLLFSVGNSLVWSVFPVCALCPAEDLPKDNNVYSSIPWTAGMAAVKNPPSPFPRPPPPPPPILRLAVRMGKLVAWVSWARFVRVMGISLAMRARTGHSSADHREVRTALSLSPPVVPLGQALVFLFFCFFVCVFCCCFCFESNPWSRVTEFEADYFLFFFLFFFFFEGGGGVVNRRSRLFL